MKESLKNIFKKRMRILFQAAVSLLCMGLIIYFMPRNNVFNYNYSESAPWNYGQIIAPFDFPIYKSEAQLQKEKDSIAAHFELYFVKDSAIAIKQLRQLKNRFYSNASEEVPREAYVNYYNTLIGLYNRGIISQSDKEIMNSNKAKKVNVINDHLASGTPKEDFITTDKAYRTLLAADTIPADLIAAYKLHNFIEPNIKYDSARSHALLEEELISLPISEGIVQNGQKIVSRGDIVDAKTYQILKSYQYEIDKRQDNNYKTTTMLLGQILFVIISFSLLLSYIYIYNPDIKSNNNKFLLVILSATIFPIITGIMMEARFSNVFLLPFSLAPMMLCLFTNPRTAFITHTIDILTCSIMLNSPYEFILLQVLAGYAAILSLKELSSRSQMFRTAFVVLTTYCTTFLAYELIVENDITKMNLIMYIYFVISSVLILFAYPLMFIIEKLLGFVSNITLIELSNLNNPLLQKLSQEAPGTFQHSMQVANLAAEAARAIGANSLEVRTGALYHDIGKSNNPIYFTENQSGGKSPHDELEYQESAQIIIRHVTEGASIAERHHLPKKIKEFIVTHHGLSKTGYFYINYKNEHPDEKINEALFTYPGPNPTTREQGILMLADCVEAASHSIKEYTAANIEKKVDDVINPKITGGELELCPLTFQDIHTIKEVFKERLKAIYHTRISYPEEKKEQKAP
ncbi:MAG: HDIG domain-containing protein [Bacteroidaceae bacterium]|nr:HDIG domain-containing protein [Bacteroidaceae bacterium]